MPQVLFVAENITQLQVLPMESGRAAPPSVGMAGPSSSLFESLSTEKSDLFFPSVTYHILCLISEKSGLGSHDLQARRGV